MEAIICCDFNGSIYCTLLPQFINHLQTIKYILTDKTTVETLKLQTLLSNNSIVAVMNNKNVDIVMKSIQYHYPNQRFTLFSLLGNTYNSFIRTGIVEKVELWLLHSRNYPPRIFPELLNTKMLFDFYTEQNDAYTGIHHCSNKDIYWTTHTWQKTEHKKLNNLWQLSKSIRLKKQLTTQHHGPYNKEEEDQPLVGLCSSE